MEHIKRVTKRSAAADGEREKPKAGVTSSSKKPSPKINFFFFFL